ncbi:maltose alpha-D-glucosyltransferase/alpha-amylase [Deinococcus yavapaiensis KR-236]|uniref:Maltose alpha-D-glucosyltransferase/alpha-amylase n=1 Tax=Deinococcus yavapaiensis KR-236 TaxID=694435 RepID=A0A318S2I8_9DEIO|nr:maltose alpha-D-glucosyltransferase/alpha-amylase [Deinococcus yavapaiensis KR-236]
MLYELNVETFQDGNGDGIGDFPGLTARVPYLVDLGVNAVWLQPFYPSPRRDHGYDVTDYKRVDPRFGTLEDFDAFVAAAHDAGIRVLLDVPFNHTSDRHPWFQAARRDPSSPYHAYYVWADTPPEPRSPYLVFPGFQTSNWSYDDASGRYYFHTFYDFMPDLDISNGAVRAEILDVARFWTRRGIDGFRLDALPYLVVDRSRKERLAHPHAFLKEFRAAVTELRPDAALLAEVDKAPDEMRPFFGDGDEMHLLLNFYLDNHLFLGLADERAEPIARAWSELPPIPRGTNWANFLRNHDELSLAQLTSEERTRVFAAFAPDASMRAYERGIRRRLAPMLRGDERRVRQAFSLLFSLPGTPVVFYGDEIGLGDRLDLPERDAVRTPMQWTAERGAGFTDAAPVRPFPSGAYSSVYVNVDAQRRDPASLLNFVRDVIRVYRSHSACGRGKFEPHDVGDPHVLAHEVRDGEDVVYALHNLAGTSREVTFEQSSDARVVLADADTRVVAPGRVALAPRGFVWWAAPSHSTEEAS